MKGVVSLVFCFCLLLLLNVNEVTAQLPTHSNTINGHVFNAQRQPVPDIYVELVNEANSTIARVKTNGSGRYFFNNLSGGTFIIKVLPFGTDLEEQSVEVVLETNGISGRAPIVNIQQDVYLRQRRDANDEKTLTGVVFVQEVPDGAKKLYEKAIEALGKKNTDEGISNLEAALTAFPTYYQALIKLGQEYAGQQKWQQAYETFKKAVAVNPKSFFGWYGLSSAAKEGQLTDEAIKAAQEALTIYPASFEAAIMLGLCQRKAKQFPEAETSFKQADKLAKGKSPDVHWNMALLYAYNLNNFAGAADRLELYLKVKPDAENIEDVKKLIKQFRQKASENK
jgi:tetratricopeptide (TPR) repeat protein